MQLPVVVLGLQPGGALTRESAERFLRSCDSRNRLYSVLCCEAGPPTSESLRATEDITKLSYERAMFTLKQYPDADVGIGLQSNTLKFISTGRIISVKMAVAALVCRRHGYEPNFIIVTDNSPGDTAHLVAQALGEWSKKHPFTEGPDSGFLEKVVKKAVGL